MQLIKPSEDYCDVRAVEMSLLVCLPRGFWRFRKAAEILEDGIHQAAIAPVQAGLGKEEWLHWGLSILKEGPLSEVPIKRRVYQLIRSETETCLSCVVAEAWNWRKARLESEGPSCDNDPFCQAIGDNWNDGECCFFPDDAGDDEFEATTLSAVFHSCGSPALKTEDLDPRLLALAKEYWLYFAPEREIPDWDLDHQFDEIVNRFCIAVQSNTREIKGNQKKCRYSVLPAVKGCRAHDCIKVMPDEKIKVFVRQGDPVVVPVDRPSYWTILNRFLKSLEKGDDHSDGHYPVDFTIKDYNRTDGEFRTFVDRFINRQPAIKKVRRKTYEPYARFRIELLKAATSVKG